MKCLTKMLFDYRNHLKTYNYMFTFVANKQVFTLTCHMLMYHCVPERVNFKLMYTCYNFCAIK